MTRRARYPSDTTDEQWERLVSSGVGSIDDNMREELVIDALGMAIIRRRPDNQPPLRGAADQAALWAGLKSETIDVLGSDHCPSFPRTTPS